MLTVLALLLAPASAATAESGTWRYAGAAGESEQGLDGIVAAVLAAPTARHFVWQPGWAEWKSWEDVPEIKAAVEKARAPAPPPPAPAAAPAGAAETWSYSDGGAPETLTAAQITERVRANPAGRHLVWNSTMPDWAPARDVAAFSAAFAPPPAPTVAPPPPPPAAKPPPPPVAAPGVPGGKGGMPNFKVGGEVRSSFSVNDLGVPETPAAITFETHRVRAFAKGMIGENWAGKVSLELEQMAVGVDADGAVVKPESWAVVPHEAWVQGRFETGKWDHRLRAGAQESVFGTRDYFETAEGYYFGGAGHEDLPRLFGTLAGEDLGVSWHTGLEDTFGLDLQVTNGEGVASPDSDTAVDILARVQARPIKYIGVWGSFMTGGRNSAAGLASLTLGDVGLEGRLETDSGLVVKVYGEVLIGALGNIDFNYPIFGAMGAGAIDVPLNAKGLDHLGLVGRYAGYDPIQGNTAPDGTYSAAGAVNLFFAGGERSTAMTGLEWEMTVPQSLEEPVTHDILVNFGAKF